MLKVQMIIVVALSMISTTCSADDVPHYQAETLSEFNTFDAKQGVAVDADHFYVANNYRITKHDKKTGEPLIQWDGKAEGAVLIHLDSLMEWNGKLYASHSNYGISPMTSSVEIWDTKTMKHVGTHSFGVNRGSFTWLDRYNGFWWGAFANYDKLKNGAPYGETKNTKIVKMDDHFNILQSWVLPENILEKIRPMSNSGGSWGPDGYLYLTGHDHGELYVMEIPDAGSILHHGATISVPAIEGQGIAWDRTSDERIIWGILKRESKVFKIMVPVMSTLRPQPKGVIRTDEFTTE